MEHCDCYKKELVELFIQFLQKENLTCTLSVFKTEIISLWGVNSFPSKYLQHNEASIEAPGTENHKTKRPRSPALDENTQPNILSNSGITGLPSPRNHSNILVSRITDSLKKQKVEVSPKQEGQPEQAERNSNIVSVFSQGGIKQNATKNSHTFNHNYKRHSCVNERNQSSRVVVGKKGRDTHNWEREQKTKGVIESKSGNSGSFEESIRNVTESMRDDPTFQDNLRNILQIDNLSMEWFSLPRKKSESLQVDSDNSLPEKEICSDNKFPRETEEGDCRVAEFTGKIDDCLDASIGGVLEAIDLDAFLGSVHAASNH